MDLEGVRIVQMGTHLRNRGITSEHAKTMDEHEARHHMASAGIVNVPQNQHTDLWNKVISSMSHAESATPADPWEGLS